MALEVRPHGRGQAGFTLVEILVVLLVLSLLAAIVIPAYFSQRAKAHDAEAKTQVATAHTAIEIYATERNGKYQGANETTLAQIEPTLSDIPAGNLTVQVQGNSGKYTLTVLSATGNQFTIRRENNDSLTYSCASPNTGGCPASGTWG